MLKYTLLAGVPGVAPAARLVHGPWCVHVVTAVVTAVVMSSRFLNITTCPSCMPGARLM